MFKKLILGFLLIFFSACNSAVASSQSADDWVNNPPSDNALYFYGVGYGSTLEDAKNDALSKISSKISVSVESTFNSSVTSNRIGDNEEVLKSIKNEVVAKSKQIQYSNVEIKKSKKIGNEYAVLVEVSRSDLVRNYKSKFDKIDARIKAEWDIFQKASMFQKLKSAAVIEKYLSKTDTIFPLLNILDENFDDSKYQKRYTTYTKKIREAKDNVYVKIISDENSQSLASLIEDELSKEGIKFSYTRYNVLLKITTKAKKRRYRSSNAKFANLVLLLEKQL